MKTIHISSSEELLIRALSHTCPVCHPDMSLTELAELYERAATAKRIARLEKQRDDFGQVALDNRVSLNISNELLHEVLHTSLGDHMTELRPKIELHLKRQRQLEEMP